jgi:hypothetical protein
MCHIQRFGVWIVSAAMAVAVVEGTAFGESIDSALRDEAPRVMKFLNDHHYRTVGVLKFEVKKGNRPVSFDAGTLNATTATRLEHALILLNDAAHPINIVHDASAAASARNRTATFRSAAGRRALFDHDYPLAWGAQSKRPDVFLTGEVLVAKDMKTLDIEIVAFDRDHPERLQDVARVKKLSVDRNVLVAIGQSFALSRGLKHRLSRDVDVEASADAAKRDDSHPSAVTDSDDPVTLQMFYDDQAVALEADSSSPGETKIRRIKSSDPKEGQKVKFVIKNVSKETVGVVLAVNGKNTLFQEDLASKPIAECTKWIIAPDESYTVQGFFMSDDGKDVRPFKVLSDGESAKSDLAPDSKGVFSMVVFPAVPAGDPGAQNISADAADLSRTPKQKGTARSLGDAQAALRSATHVQGANGRLVADSVAKHPIHAARRVVQKNGSRGLVVEDAQSTTGSSLNRVPVKLDASPSMSLFIRYYSGPATVSAN